MESSPQFSEAGPGALARDPEHTRACSALYREQGAFVWRALRHVGVPSSDLEDALQEVFLVVHRKLHTWDRRCSVKTWLFGIARMVAMGLRKRAHVRRERPVEAVPDRVDDRTPDHQAARAQALARALGVVEAMEEDLRLVFCLYELEELPMREVADALSIPLQTAYSRLHRAREAFARGAKKGGGA